MCGEMKVLLAEKPDQAEKYARSFENAKKQKGVWIVNDSQLGEIHIVNALGHLFELNEPETYNQKWKQWNMADLPIIPQEFVWHLDTKKARAFKTIKQEVEKADGVIIGTDADREGENIAYSILSHIPNGTSKIIKRLWINSLTKKGINDAFQKLRNASETKNYYYEARARQKSDWLVGMTMSRLTTIQLQTHGFDIKGGYPVGRAQTATVAYIVNNDTLIKNFKKHKFYELELTDNNGIVYQNSEQKFKSFDEAQKALSSLSANSLVKSFEEKKDQHKSAPKLMALAQISKVAANRWGYSAKQTLKIVQSLYDVQGVEDGYISYPRTHCRMITENEFKYLSENVNQYQNLLNFHFSVKNPQPRKKYVDGTKVKEHYALIPTAALPILDKLNEPQRNIYETIVKHTLLMFAGDEISNQRKITLQNQGYEFVATDKKIVDPGFMALVKESVSKSRKNDFPEYEVDQQVMTTGKIVEKETKPVNRVTEANLSDPILPKLGIGTPATRADMIELIKKHGYVIKNKKGELLPTVKAYVLCQYLEGTMFTKPELTAGWEKYLAKIGEGKGTENKFVGETENLITKLVQELPQLSLHITAMEKQKVVTPTRDVLSNMGECPKCHKGHIQEINGNSQNGKYHGYFCDNEKCKFGVPGTWGGTTVSKEMVTQLLENGKTSVLKFKSKKGTPYQASLGLDKSFKVIMNFVNKK